MSADGRGRKCRPSAAKDRQGNNCRVFNVVITLRRYDIVVTAERDDYNLGDTCSFAGP